MGATLAVDLGGTTMRAAAVDDTGAIVARSAAPTPRRGPTLDPLVRAALERLGPAGPRAEVVGAELGDDSGLIGAAAWRGAI